MLDANFRLKLKDRNFKNTSLSDGWSYFVEDSKYQNFISKMGDQKEVMFVVLIGLRSNILIWQTKSNTCSVEHKAIRNANVKHNGYLASGVAACLCSRHLLVRGSGFADLQKGEKYLEFVPHWFLH